MKVLYVLGRGRSGSTIFANVLGELDGYFAGGELRVLWDPVVVQHGSCGCGEPITRCAVWSGVLDRVSDIDAEEAAMLQREIVRESNTLRLLLWPGRSSWPARERFAQLMRRVYEAVADVTGARVIVDSSKRPSYAAFLRTVPGCDPYYVHLVREPRASAYSWQNRRYESARSSGVEVTRRGALDATLRWDLLNLGSEGLLRTVGTGRGMTMRYEDFIAEPQHHVEQVAQLLGETSWRSPFLDDHTVVLRPNHTIAGNPSRFATGTLVLEDRAEWTVKQARFDRWVSTAVALPFLRHYGYPVKPATPI